MQSNGLFGYDAIAGHKKTHHWGAFLYCLIVGSDKSGLLHDEWNGLQHVAV